MKAKRIYATRNQNWDEGVSQTGKEDEGIF